jgi:hypothetical protein
MRVRNQDRGRDGEVSVCGSRMSGGLGGSTCLSAFEIWQRNDPMKTTIQVAILLCLGSALSFAESWAGTLVDSKCYDSMERNVNPFETSGAARDTTQHIRYCSPKDKTKTFAIVLDAGMRLQFDSNGNSKAAELVRKPRRKTFAVVVTGEMSGNEIKVDSISLAR